MSYKDEIKSPHSIPCICGKVKKFSVRTGKLSKCLCPPQIKSYQKYNFTLSKGEGEDFKGDKGAWKAGGFNY